MTYRVRLAPEAEADLLRLYDFVIERELASAAPELDAADRAMEAIRKAFELLERFPFTCRKVGTDPFVRELVIAFGHDGYVALFEVIDDRTVVIAAVRHQREDDYR